MTPDRTSQAGRSPSPRRRAGGVALSGGGAGGAYEVGVLRALARGESPATGLVPLEVSMFTGASIGAYNAAFLVSRSRRPLTEAIEDLAWTWRHRLTTRPLGDRPPVYRFRFDPSDLLYSLKRPDRVARNFLDDTAVLAHFLVSRLGAAARSSGSLGSRMSLFLDPGVLISSTGFARLVRETIRLRDVRDAPTSLAVFAVGWQSGRVRVFFSDRLRGEKGYQILAATAAIPGLLQPVEVDEEPLVDGGLLNNSPLGPLVINGCDPIHVVVSFAEPEAYGHERWSDLFRTLSRLSSMIWSQRLTTLIKVARAVHMLAALKEDAGSRSREVAEFLELMAGWGVDPKHSVEDYQRTLARELPEIHIHRPSTTHESGPGWLDFGPGHIDKLLRRGYQDALRHDCKVAGCLIPPRAAARRTETASGPMP